MDLQLPGMNGIEAIRHIKLISPHTQAVVLTVMKDSDFIDIALAAGATAFIHKQHMHEELIPAIKKLLHPEINEGKES
jgi:NarL family two-component system response regulator LiaR